MKPLSKTKKKIVAGAILIVLAVAATFLATFAMNHYQGATRLVNRYVDSVNNKNAKEFVNCFPPSYQPTVESLVTKAGGDEAFFKQTYSGMFEGETPYESFGENVVISVSEPKAEQQTITDGIYKGMNMEQMEATAVSVVSCTMTTKGSLREVSEQVEVTCVKINRKWYMLSMAAVTPDETQTPTDVQ